MNTSDIRTQANVDRHEGVTAHDIYEASVLAAAHELGYRLAIKCSRCGQYLVNAKSVQRHLGPVCAAKVVGDV